MIIILSTMLVMSCIMEKVSSLNQDIVLRFGDNSLRIEQDSEDRGREALDRSQRLSLSFC